ncbi:MAG TPA: hypothetical protein VHE99_08250 [Gammaproteobacteria bacterium]|nr:hypothetical protein [Gammaproteobacteria bacterium]
MESKPLFSKLSTQTQTFSIENIFSELSAIIPSKKTTIEQVQRILAYEELLLKYTLPQNLQEYLTTEHASLAKIAPKIMNLITTIKELELDSKTHQDKIDRIRQNLTTALDVISASLSTSEQYIASQLVTSADYNSYGLS